jgi:hypothetical protein
MVSTTGKKYHLFATGQVSITNPNPGAGVVGSHPVQKVTKFTPPSSNPSAVRRPKLTGPGIAKLNNNVFKLKLKGTVKLPSIHKRIFA